MNDVRQIFANFKMGDDGQNDLYPGSLEESHLSDISFPSHVSGLESFVDLEETLDKSIGADDNHNDEIYLSERGTLSNALSQDGSSTNILKDFLKMSSPPASCSNSLNESSMSMSKLEALQVNMQDSFLNSHSDDREREKQILCYLEQPNLSSENNKNTPSLNSIIEYNKEIPDQSIVGTNMIMRNLESRTPDKSIQMNQTELDSLYLKEVRQRLLLSNMDSINESPTTKNEIDETLLQIDEETQVKDETGGISSDLEHKLSSEIKNRSIEDGFDRNCIETIQRPNLDGSSSDSDNDGAQSAGGATNFARTGIHTSTLTSARFNLHQQLEELNLEDIPERQLAEGGDNNDDVFNDGGGGGDGSSGHSEDDGGGDGGVSIRNVVRQAPMVGFERDSSSDGGRMTPPSRERPVGGSGPRDHVVRPRQVQFTANQVIVTSADDTSSNNANQVNSNDTQNITTQDGTPTNQDSRLSARYFLAASTPFKPTDQTTMQTDNWLSPSSFHVSQVQNQDQERTLIGEYTIATPNTAMLSQLRKEHGDVPDLTFGSPSLLNPTKQSKLAQDIATVGKTNNSLDKNHQMENSPQDPLSNTFDQTLQPNQQFNPFDNTLHSKHSVYNPFESVSSDTLGFNFDASIIQSKDFDTNGQDLEGMLLEDEKVVALNNNSVYKMDDETVVSEWSMHSENHRINSAMLPPPADTTNDDGRVSMYFKAKSNNMGELSGGEGQRPNFSDDSHQVITPPSTNPLALVREMNTVDQTIPGSAISTTFLIDSPDNDNTLLGRNSSTIETPKSALLSTHKRHSATVLKKTDIKPVGKEGKLPKAKKRADQIVKNTKDSKLAKERSKTPTPKTTNDNRFNTSISIPVSETEADLLLNNIKSGRVSMAGMSKMQIMELAKCISSMTGTDINLVYQLILLLPRNLGNFKEDDIALTDTSQVEKQQDCSIDADLQSQSSYTPLKNHTNFSTHYVKSPVRSSEGQLVNTQQAKPISSVLPLNNDIIGNIKTSTQNEMVERNLYYLKNHSNLQSTRLVDRFSDPNPVTLTTRMNTDHRLAVSVSPVRHPRTSKPYVELSSNYDLSKRSVVRNCFEKEPVYFQPLPPHSNLHENTTNYFHPLQQLNASRSVSQPELSYINEYGPYNNLRSNNRLYSSGNSSSNFTHCNSSISFPRDVSFDVCCIGTNINKLVQIHNSNSCWMQCQLQVVFSAYNGREMDCRQMEVFSFPPKLTLEPHSTEDLKMKFNATQPGTYMIKVELMTTQLIAEEMNMKWQRLPHVLNVEGIAEVPDLEVLLNENKCIDFGDVSYGSHTIQDLQILNKGRADVPIKLCIAQGTIASKHFIFETKERTNNVHGNSSITLLSKGRKHAGEPMKPTYLALKFNAPFLPEGDSHHLQNTPEELTCQLDIETDSKQTIPISSILMKAMVGVSRLHSLRTMQAITLESFAGEQASRMIPLKNAGSIPLNLEAKILGAPHFFSIQPSLVSIKPGMETEIKVTFKSNIVETVESRLVVNVLPYGEQYEWCLRGSSTSKSIYAKEKPLLLCNKLSLNWGGVPIGQSKQQKLLLRNDSETEYLHLYMNISGDHSNFQIQNDFILKQKSINKFEAVLKPQAELPVHVLFIPTSFAMVNSSLVLRTLNGATKFVIPLTGYGGASNIDINGAKKLNDQFYINMGDVYLGKRNIIDILLRNSGTRPAFVSMSCYTDITARLEYPSTHVNITPNNFVLMEKTSCRVTLVHQPLKDHALKSQEGTFTTAHLVIYSGDEVLRKEYRRNQKSHFKTNNNSLEILNSVFANEQDVSEEMSYCMVSDWDSFFHNNISRTVIAMVATPSLQYDAEKLSSVDKFQTDISHVTPAQRLKPQAVISGNKSRKELWSVSPEQIILCSSEDSAASKLKLVNNSDIPLPFEFIWPAQTLVITPCKDKIPPRSQLMIRINAKPSFLSRKDDIPWKGSIYIQCDGEQKCVNVQIRSDVIHDQSPGYPLSTQQLTSVDVHDISLVPHQHKTPSNNQDIVISPLILEIQNTKVNMVAESCFTITNKADMACRWFLSSIAPPYFKSIDGRGEIVRATYTAFRFAKHSGRLDGKQSFKLPVSFLPRAGGMYSQFWDFEASYDESKQAPVKYRVELIGQGSTSEKKKSFSPETSRKQIGTAKPILMNQKREQRVDDKETSEKKQRNGHTFVKDDNLEFPLTKAGERSEMKFRLCNDSNEVQKVRISGFHSPFTIVVKHTKLSVRPKSYIRVPVFYSPTTSNESSQCLLVLTPENGETLCVRLNGNST